MPDSNLQNANACYTDRIDRLHQISRRLNLDFCLLCSPSTLAYYSGYFYYFEHGPSPFQVLPALFITSVNNGSALLLADNEKSPATTAHDLSIYNYTSYTYREPLNVVDQFLAGLNNLIGNKVTSITRIGIESSFLPVIITDAIGRQFPGVEWVDISRDVTMERIIKDQLEIDMIKRAAELCDIGQRTLQKNIRKGQSELELFSLVSTKISEASGTRVPLMADFVAGHRTAQGGGIPSDKIILDGELVLADLTPCLNGYWGDCCGTVVAGSATNGQMNDFIKIKDGLSRAIDAVKPGVKACEIDALLRTHVSDYPHHSGHGVGTMNHEEPRITPYNQIALQAGMVIALEPAIYREDYGIRLEHLLLVTNDAAELMTTIDYKLM